MKRLVLILLLCGVAFLRIPAQEEEPTFIDETQLTFETEEATQAENAENVAVPALGFRDFARVFLFLAVVIAVIYLFFWFLRRLSGRSNNPQEIVSVLATQVLRNDQALYLVEIGEQVLLLGGGSGNLSLITEIENKDTLDSLRLNASRQQAGKGSSFMQFLQGTKMKFSPNSSSASQEDDSFDLRSLDEKKKRLRDL